MFSIVDKNLLITGAGSGIGLSLVQHFVSSGCKVTAIDINPSKELKLEDVNIIQADVSDPDGLKSAFRETVSNNGKLDAVINNAGIALSEGPISNADIANLERAFNVNVKGVYLGMKYASSFLNDGGSIVNTASLAATVTLPEYCAYSMSKSAVVQMTKNGALQLGQRNIRVNSVSPGTVITPMESEDGVEANLARLTTALSRPASTEDLLGVYHFLISEASKYITGVDIKVDGGWSAGLTYQAINKLTSGN